MNELLARLGWSQAFLSRHIEVDARTVGRWASGETEPPKLLIIYLTQCCDLIGV